VCALPLSEAGQCPRSGLELGPFPAQARIAGRVGGCAPGVRCGRENRHGAGAGRAGPLFHLPVTVIKPKRVPDDGEFRLQVRRRRPAQAVQAVVGVA
jgi:hypothetical protein